MYLSSDVKFSGIVAEPGLASRSSNLRKFPWPGRSSVFFPGALTGSTIASMARGCSSTSSKYSLRPHQALQIGDLRPFLVAWTAAASAWRSLARAASHSQPSGMMLGDHRGGRVFVRRDQHVLNDARIKRICGPDVSQQRGILQYAAVVGGAQQDVFDQFRRNRELQGSVGFGCSRLAGGGCTVPGCASAGVAFAGAACRMPLPPAPRRSAWSHSPISACSAAIRRPACVPLPRSAPRLRLRPRIEDMERPASASAPQSRCLRSAASQTA